MRSLLLLLLVLPGCFINRSHVNQPIDPAAVARLEPGRSTAADVVNILGAPTEVIQLGKRSAYRYDHTHGKQAALFLIIFASRGIDTMSDRVWVFLDENDVLTHVGSTFEADDAQYHMPVFRSKD